ncbi:ABC transporter substrate-binding protein [Ktedonobacter sp. SOSP1-85]|uniref:ABC transporter substrate-binding protein n=1 Tax=unclassified Ktedonobacter TaxID=388461 RepID=UPI001915D0BD|nr:MULTISPECIES: extracellular solute-binding protein [unclassified Ktedonobacter]GHO66835.1 ABC transporter substrate-binding protein [Ktedonobacter sp. SOSP1-52]GHO73916.1 ABC transporter substrate-binding protein [Ktedonobacter sp. SOSP1-85]
MHLPISRRRFLIDSGNAALGASIAGALLAACGGQSSGANVEYWYGLDDGKQRNYMKAHDIDAFNKANPNININISFKPTADVDRLIQIALSSGKGPDIVPTPGPAYALQYINANLLLDLSSYADKYHWKDKISPWALDAGRIHNKLYSLPGSYQTLIIYYNKTLFSQKGWKVPTNRSELEALAQEAQGQGIMPFIAGNADSRPSSEWYTTMFFNHYAGPQAVYQALTGEIPWTDPVFVDAITLLRQYFQKGWFGGGIQQYFTNKFDALDSAFGKGKAAMDVEGSWAFSNWSSYFGKGNSDMEYDWFPIPPLREGVPSNLYALGIGYTLSIKASSKTADAAATYLDWLYSTPQRAVQETADINYPPPPIPLKATDFSSNIDPRVKNHYLALNQAASQGNFGYTTWTFWPSKSEVVAYESLDKVLTGDLTPAQFCAQMNDTFQKERAQGVVPPIPKGRI